MKKVLLLFVSLLVSTALMAQNHVITGSIIDEETGDPLTGATVQEVGGVVNGVITNIDGEFRLTLSRPTSEVKVTYLGYIDQTVKVSGGQHLSLKLKPESQTLGETVVIGYSGTIVRAKLTNSISKVKPEALTTGMFSNPAQALSGQVSGLRVVQNTGNPNSAPTIVLRGGTDYDGSGSPLVVIDGMIRSMTDINPNDIESMEVMKDAGATAIYGSRANNGVILITTKQGKKGEGKINFNTKISWNYFNNPYEFVDAGDYLYYMRKAYVNANEKGTTNLNSLQGAQPYGTGNYYEYDGNKSSYGIWGVYLRENLSDETWGKMQAEGGWYTMTDPVTGKELVYCNNHMEDFNVKTPSFSQDYNVNYSGGNDRGHYYAGLGYNRSEGNAINNWNRRQSAILNADYKIKPWLTSVSNFNFSNTKYRGISPFVGEADYFSRNFSYPPTFRAYNADGELLLGKNSGDGNQKFLEDAFDNDYSRQKFTFAQDFRFNIFDGLTLDLKGDWFYEYYTYEYMYKSYLSSPNYYNNRHNSYAEHEKQLTQTYNILLNYNKSFGLHSVSALLGWEYFHQKYFNLEASGYNPENYWFKDLGYTITDEGARTIDSSHSKFITESYFARVNYDYDARYLASITLRRDGISRLHKDHRWGTFPGASVGWVFSREPFMEKYSNWLSFGKLRASYGRNGNVNTNYVGNYTVQGSYPLVKYNSSTGYYLSTIPNDYLTWETSRTFELGLNLGFLNNRLQAGFTWYDRRTFDKYASIIVPASSGWTSITSNNGTLQNRGIELDINYRILDTSDWKVNAGLTLASNRNKVIKLPDNGNERNRQGGFQVYTGNGDEMKWVGGYAEGERPGDLWVFQAEGIYKSYDEIPGNLIDKSTSHNSGSNKFLYGPDLYEKEGKASGGLAIMPGDVKWKDVNGDGVIDDYDLVKVGNTTPKVIGGFNLSASWKGLTLSGRFDYALGFKIYDYRTPWIMGNMQGTYSTLTDVKNTWSAENPNGTLPIYIWADQLNARNYDRYSTLFVHNGNYLSFREITLAYSLPQQWLTPLHIEKLELSVTGQNLGYWSKAKNIFSPEVASNNGGYPLPRMLVLGLNVTF